MQIICMLGLCFNKCFSFLEPAGVKEEAGSPAGSKQEVLVSADLVSV